MSAQFWAKVRKQPGDGCWEWTGSFNDKGYGKVRVDGRMVRAHRVAWELAHGPLSLPADATVCHRCDNPACVRPDHLFLGTQLDNIRDRDAKGRAARGAQTGAAKLSDEDVRAIRAAAGDLSGRALARRYGVSHVVVQGILRGESWRHVR